MQWQIEITRGAIVYGKFLLSNQLTKHQAARAHASFLRVRVSVRDASRLLLTLTPSRVLIKR